MFDIYNEQSLLLAKQPCAEFKWYPLYPPNHHQGYIVVYCRAAAGAGCSISTLMATNDSLLDTGSSGHHSSAGVSPKANEIFHCEAANTKLPGLKRKFIGVGGDTEPSRAKLACSAASLISPPLFKPRANLAMVPGYPHENGTGASNHDNAAQNQEDEWKNIKVVSSSEKCLLQGLIVYFLDVELYLRHG